jgi:outer membrane protein OmpA-like peptidoglycan-associated protein
MAQLDVQPKQRSPIWIWIVVFIVVMGVLFMLLRGCNSAAPLKIDQADTTADDTVVTANTTSAATTQPDWNAVDFTIPKASYEEVTDTAVMVRGNQQYTIYSLGENVLFGKDDSKIREGASAKLNQIAASLDKRFKNAFIGVYGHTDSTGNAGHNKTLGAQRANAVKDWLITNAGVAEQQISVHSLGETKPLAPNTTDKGKAQNRSVEIVAFPDSTSTQ